MVAAEVTSITKKQIDPTLGQKMAFYTYTKANATDTIDCSAEFYVVKGAFAWTGSGETTATVGDTVDPATVATTVVSLTVGIGPGFAIVMGD